MFIKVFNHNLKVHNQQFKIGKTYSARNIEEFFSYYKDINDTIYDAELCGGIRYCEVKPIGKLTKRYGRLITNKIKIIRELTIEELINLDTTGEWCCDLIVKMDVVKRHSAYNLIMLSSHYNWDCSYFAKKIKNTGLTIEYIQNKIVEKNKPNKK